MRRRGGNNHASRSPCLCNPAPKARAKPPAPYGQNPKAAELYEFIKSMEMYRNTIGKHSALNRFRPFQVPEVLGIGGNGRSGVASTVETGLDARAMGRLNMLNEILHQHPSDDAWSEIHFTD
jgi:hypothetical protein